jgi:hypothetical protein
MTVIITFNKQLKWESTCHHWGAFLSKARKFFAGQKDASKMFIHYGIGPKICSILDKVPVVIQATQTFHTVSSVLYDFSPVLLASQVCELYAFVSFFFDWCYNLFIYSVQ